jgi:hypothetical protein
MLTGDVVRRHDAVMTIDHRRNLAGFLARWRRSSGPIDLVASGVQTASFAPCHLPLGRDRLRLVIRCKRGYGGSIFGLDVACRWP